jgi:hypothetical protein
MTEYARVKTPGWLTEGQQGAVGFLRALADQPAAGPPIGRNGKPQAWNLHLGFHDDLRDITDDTARHLSPAARARRAARRLEEFDQGILADWRAGRRAGSERVVLEARQRQAGRAIVEHRIRSRSRIA